MLYVSVLSLNNKSSKHVLLSGPYKLIVLLMLISTQNNMYNYQNTRTFSLRMENNYSVLSFALLLPSTLVRCFFDWPCVNSCFLALFVSEVVGGLGCCLGLQDEVVGGSGQLFSSYGVAGVVASCVAVVGGTSCMLVT